MELLDTWLAGASVDDRLRRAWAVLLLRRGAPSGDLSWAWHASLRVNGLMFAGVVLNALHRRHGIKTLGTHTLAV